MSSAPVLPETAAVYWRPRLDAARLRRRELGWTLSTLAHTIPFLAVAALMLDLEPLSFPVAALALVHAWGIPALYANRGACVVRPRRRAADGPERTALGLLGDLLGHEARELHARTGLALERGRLGVWLVGEAGALLVRPGGRRVDCWCVKVDAAICRRPTAPRTCCSRCARTRPASPPSRTSPSAARRGGSAAGSPKPMRPALAAAARAPRCIRPHVERAAAKSGPPVHGARGARAPIMLVMTSHHRSHRTRRLILVARAGAHRAGATPRCGATASRGSGSRAATSRARALRARQALVRLNASSLLPPPAAPRGGRRSLSSSA